MGFDFFVPGLTGRKRTARENHEYLVAIHRWNLRPKSSERRLSECFPDKALKCVWLYSRVLARRHPNSGKSPMSNDEIWVCGGRLCAVGELFSQIACLMVFAVVPSSPARRRVKIW